MSSAPTLVTTNGQMMAAGGGKPCLPTAQMLAKGTVMGPGTYVPATSANQQTLVINPLGILSTGQSILPAQHGPKGLDKGKPYVSPFTSPPWGGGCRLGFHVPRLSMC